MKKPEKEKKQLIMLVGLPGSGKSTYLKENPYPSSFVTLSTDDYIDEKAKKEGKTYDDLFQSTIKEATEHMMKKLDQAVKDGASIIWDQMNITAKVRAKGLSKVPDDYEKIALVFNPPLDVVKKRAAARAKQTGKTIPDFVLNRPLEFPTKEEGFSKVLDVTNWVPKSLVLKKSRGAGRP